jgi:NAD(P)-dependent dehydrogenase (short-subunit alcohol dehydrogenase family)
MQEQKLKGKLALVSGAAGGMGQQHCRTLAAAGAKVVATDRFMTDTLESLAQEIDGVAIAVDVSNHLATRQMYGQLQASYGDVEILVANHAYMSMSGVVEADLEDWWCVIDTNLGGTFNLIQSALPGMRRLGRGKIVVISSEWGVIGWPNATAYASSKAGLIAMVKTLGRELAPEGIQVNAIAPGVTDTPQLLVDAAEQDISIEEMHAVYAKGIPMGRIGKPAEISAAVMLLSDPQLNCMVGQIVQVNGGSTRTRV